MKSKSFDLRHSSAEKQREDKTLDFVGLYKPAAETYKVAEKRKSDASINKETSKNNIRTPKRERSPNKNKKRSKQEQIDVSEINIDGSNLKRNFGRISPVNDPKVTSTPNTSIKHEGQTGRVKSIMKNKSSTEQSLDSPRSNMSSGKPKKRNKSVSFMLDDNEEVMVKRSKSDDSSKVNKKSENAAKTNLKDKRKNIKKFKKDQQSEKENKAADINNQHMEVDSGKTSTKEKRTTKVNKAKHLLTDSASAPTVDVQNQENKEKKKKFKKPRKHKSEQTLGPTDTEINNDEATMETKIKKLKKKKQLKPPTAETIDNEGEPAPKSRKKDLKADIAEDLENLSIGDNAHTLTNMLDEMTVVDKDKRKKMRQKFSKNKKAQGPNSIKEDSEKSDEVKEKVKWKKRKWNKDKKGEADEDSLANTVIVENLPISIMLNYKKLLTEHFVKYGLIKKIGLAEVYPSEESKPVFTTTINFGSDGAADQALQENSTYFEGSRIRVKRALPATQTTVVVRSYAELTDQALSTAFFGAGRIRSIRHLVKGKKSMSTAFVEFDGPEAVERAIKTAGDAKIGGKKTHLAKFELRAKKIKKPKNDGDSAADADSEDSND